MKLLPSFAIAIFVTSVAVLVKADDFPYDLEMDWFNNDADSTDCTENDKYLVDYELFTGTNTVLDDAGYDEYYEIEDEGGNSSSSDDDRRELRGLQAACLGPTSLCTRNCIYSQRLCVMIYKCICRRQRRAQASKQRTRHRVLVSENQLETMCTNTLADMSTNTAITSTCQTALAGAGCKVTLTSSDD